jgi:hypothetical protein
VAIVTAGETREVPISSKAEVAASILDLVEELRAERVAHG